MQQFFRQVLNLFGYLGNLSVSQSVSLGVSKYYISVCLSQSAILSVSLSIYHPPISLSVYLFIHPSIYPNGIMFIVMELHYGNVITLQYQSVSIIYLSQSISHSVCISIYPSMHLTVCVYPSIQINYIMVM